MSSDIIACTRIAINVDFMRVDLPPWLRIFVLQGYNRPAALSMTSCSWAANYLRRPNGKTKYLHDNVASLHPRVAHARATSSLEHRMGCIKHFARLVRRQNASPQASKMVTHVLMSNTAGLTKVTTSSAYITVWCATLGRRG